MSDKYPNSRAIWREVTCFVGWSQPCKVCGDEFASKRMRLYCDKHKDPKNRTAAARHREITQARIERRAEEEE